MPVGTTTDFDVTRTELVDLSLGEIGVSEPGQNDRVLAIKLLNILIRNLDARGDWLHAISNTESTLTLIGNQQAYATGSGASLIATNIVDLEYVAVLIGNRREDVVIFDKMSSLRTRLQDDSPGQPVAVHLETAKLRSDQRMLFYPTPNQAYSIVYKFRRPLFDFDTTSDNPDFPSQFILPLSRLLAYELAPHFGIPLPERQALLAEGEKSYSETVAGLSGRPAYVAVRTEYF